MKLFKIILYVLLFAVFLLTINYYCALKFVPVRGFLFRYTRDYDYYHKYGAYGYLVFTSRPSKETMARYEFICDAYLRNLDPINDYSYGRECNFQLMVTFWLLEWLPQKQKLSDCKWLISNYDYSRAKEIAAAVDRLSSQGPLLIAWDRPYELGQSQYQPLILDLSDFDNQDMDRAFAIWRDRISREPAVWKKGFDLVLAREAFRNLIQKYGQQILSLLEG